MSSPSSALEGSVTVDRFDGGQLVVRIDGSHIYPRMMVGGKAHGLSKIRAAGLPTPPAFNVTVDACRQYFEAPDRLMERVWPQIQDGIGWLETESGHMFGRGPVPLLVSVRSGAPASMPGMMDTVLNLGINADVEQLLAQKCGQRFAADTHHRFRELFRQVVNPADGEIPADPFGQLKSAVTAVFESWNSPRAVSYRRHHNLEGKMAGTSVTVQAMVFGNLDDESGTGVLFSRNPLNGENRPYGEWLPRGQGEDVVSGKFDPLPLITLAESHPVIHQQLLEAARWLEKDGADVQDIEFTVEAGRLYLLQTRAAKRSAQAAVSIAVALQREGLIDTDEALSRVTPAQLDTLLTSVIEPSVLATATVVATGLPACPGVGVGLVVTDSDSAEDAFDEGEDVVLARETTSPDDVGGMIASRAVITEQGGSTSHAAVVSRELHTPCVVGCGKGSLQGLAGVEVTVDGAAGKIYAGALRLTEPSEELDPDMSALLGWARERSPIEVHRVGTPAAKGLAVVDHRDPSTIAAVFRSATAVSAEHPLPALLAIIQRARNTQDGFR
ncbi:pyruvate, phosphate dikinase [Mycobacterium sp. CVI_P3]|uniref:Pyruvate, phosphate dikinase n=1 Tax=Mycobacterium pinniadriaticum TaxID=2994102 RepID=A0ABT3SC19_9MYCO|nr:pyruvate, phosphate dikinase [Mycobacterium pinniadriaticum]MCX2930610.1 pyruvate, phosphate dikinase [Mycobacterium pinniadriaticum]MCX2937034.1 pyruvate, phosphate dikinase [Mycobacterium pinniadriaticum]